MIQLYILRKLSPVSRFFSGQILNSFYKISQIGQDKSKFNDWRTQTDSCSCFHLQMTPWITQLANIILICIILKMTIIEFYRTDSSRKVDFFSGKEKMNSE